MSESFRDYIAQHWAGIKEGAGDVAVSAFLNIRDDYQQFLMADASISPSNGMAGTFETVTTEIERNQPEPAALESYDPPGNDPIPGLDIG